MSIVVDEHKKLLKELHEKEILFTRFSSWDDAEKAGYRTRRQWRQLGKGVKGRSFATIQWKGTELSLYHLDQTTNSRPKTLAIVDVLDRFVVRTDIFGYQPYRSDEWPQCDWYRWDVQDLIRKGFNHQRCHERGIQLNEELLVQAFAIRCGEKTDFFVLDLDCHDPGDAQVAAHLELVEIVLDELPTLLETLGGGSVFYQVCACPAYVILLTQLEPI